MLFSSGVRFQRRELVALHLAATISRSRRPARRDRCKTDERGGGSPQVRSTFFLNSLPTCFCTGRCLVWPTEVEDLVTRR